jgi:mannose-6-phosphate isomerase
LAEIQQNSDTTFRLYDYGRGRELHIREGLAATKENTRAGKIAPRQVADHCRLVDSPCFAVDKYRLDQPRQFTNHAAASALNLVAIGGCGVVECSGMEAITFVRGETVVVPAGVGSFRIRPQWSLELLLARLP